MGIKLKEGLCNKCNDGISKPIIGKREKALCTTHYQESLRLKSGPIAKKSKAIAPISKSRAEALKRYRRLRDKHFEEYPVCQFPGCTSRKITLHHARGRLGAFLTDKRYFRSLCQEHHRYVELHPDEAQKLNLSQKRLDKHI